MSNERTFSRQGCPLTGEEAAPFDRAIARYLPGRRIVALADRGEWVRRIVIATLDDGQRVVFKLIDPAHEGGGWVLGQEGESHERDVHEIMARHGLTVAPRVLAVDYSCAVLPQPYVLQEYVGGTRLEVLLQDADDGRAAALYETIGRLYRRIHAIRAAKMGLWIGSTPDAPWGEPVEYMYQAEVVEGGGQQALEQGRISRRTYERMVAVWAAHLDELRSGQPCLVHYSPFTWNIYLAPDGDGWRVTKLTSLGDVMWWEAAWDLACLRFPPFGAMTPARWEAFARGYGPLPDRRWILLYAVMQRLSAAAGSYWELSTPDHAAWASHALDDMDELLDEIEGM